MSITLESTILAHAESLKFELDSYFIEAVKSGVKNLGVLNLKIPNAFVQAALKTLSPKLQPGSHLPSINVFSVPVCQKYDYAGENAGYFRAFRFLVSIFAFNGTRQTIIDDVINDGPAVHNHPAHVELRQQYACSLALRSALSEVVRQLDPNHPLVKDLFLQSKIRKAGLTAFTLANLDYNAARIAGLSFVLAKPAAKDAG